MEKFIYYNELYLVYKNLLNEKEQEVFDMYYGDNLTMQEIADNLDISKARVGIIIKNVTKKLDKYEKTLKLNSIKHELNNMLEINNIDEIRKRIDIILKGE